MTLAMLRMQVGVEQRIFWRNRSSVFFTFVLPIALLFALGLSDDPVDVVPLIAALGVLSTGFQGLAIQVAMHRDQGVLKRLMATPLPASALVLGKVVSTMLVLVIELGIVVLVGVTVFGAPVPEHPLALVGVLLLGTVCFVAMGFALASLVPNGDAAPAVTNAAYLGLLLATALLAKLDGMPGWLHDAGGLLPLQSLVEPVQHAWMGPWDGVPWASLASLAVWGLIATAWVARRFRWEPAGER